jgi:hypothetical protein
MSRLFNVQFYSSATGQGLQDWNEDEGKRERPDFTQFVFVFNKKVEILPLSGI